MGSGVWVWDFIFFMKLEGINFSFLPIDYFYYKKSSNFMLGETFAAFAQCCVKLVKQLGFLQSSTSNCKKKN